MALNNFHDIATNLLSDIEHEISGIKDLVDGIKEVEEGQLEDQVDYVISHINKLLSKF